MIIIYRPPPSAMNGSTADMFFTEFTSILEQMNIESDQFLIADDFNFHVKNLDNNGRKFMNLLDTFNLIQHVQETTHVTKHILDLVITHRENSEHCFFDCSA